MPLAETIKKSISFILKMCTLIRSNRNLFRVFLTSTSPELEYLKKVSGYSAGLRTISDQIYLLMCKPTIPTRSSDALLGHKSNSYDWAIEYFHKSVFRTKVCTDLLLKYKLPEGQILGIRVSSDQSPHQYSQETLFIFNSVIDNLRLGDLFSSELIIAL